MVCKVSQSEEIEIVKVERPLTVEVRKAVGHQAEGESRKPILFCFRWERLEPECRESARVRGETKVTQEKRNATWFETLAEEERLWERWEGWTWGGRSRWAHCRQGRKLRCVSRRWLLLRSAVFTLKNTGAFKACTLWRQLITTWLSAPYLWQTDLIRFTSDPPPPRPWQHQWPTWPLCGHLTIICSSLKLSSPFISLLSCLVSLATLIHYLLWVLLLTVSSPPVHWALKWQCSPRFHSLFYSAL